MCGATSKGLPVQEKPNTKDVILDAAESVVARDGSGRLTIDAVAAESQVSKGGVLYHYPNKLALLEAMVARMIDSVLNEIITAREAAEAAGAPVLPRVVEALLDRMKARDNVSQALLAASAEQPGLLETATAPIAVEFQRIADSAADPVLAQIILLSLDGLKLSQLLGLSHVRDVEVQPILERLLAMSREMHA